MQYACGILQPPADKTGGNDTICPQRGNSAIESCCPPSNPAPPPMKANGFHGFSYFQPFQTIFLNFHVRAASKRRGYRSRNPFPMKPFAERASQEAAASLPLTGRYHKKPLGEISDLQKEPWIWDGSQKHLFFCSPCSYTVICALITRKYGMPFCSPDLNVPVTVISLSNSG